MDKYYYYKYYWSILKLSWHINIIYLFIFYDSINHLNIHRNCVFKSCALVDFGYVVTLGITFVDCKRGKFMHTVVISESSTCTENMLLLFYYFSYQDKKHFSIINFSIYKKIKVNNINIILKLNFKIIYNSYRLIISIFNKKWTVIMT